MYLAPPLDDDEGFDEPASHDGGGQDYLDAAAARLAYRRSTDFSTLEGRVVRPIRLRKRPRRAEATGGGSASTSTVTTGTTGR